MYDASVQYFTWHVSPHVVRPSRVEQTHEYLEAMFLAIRTIYHHREDVVDISLDPVS